MRILTPLGVATFIWGLVLGFWKRPGGGSVFVTGDSLQRLDFLIPTLLFVGCGLCLLLTAAWIAWQDSALTDDEDD